MSDDVLITPASRKIEFKDSDGNIDGKIELDSSGNLNITAPGGDIGLGDSSADIFVGDGTNNVDIVFEQNGEIRGLTGVTLTLGQSDSDIAIAADNFTSTADLQLNNADIVFEGSTADTFETTLTVTDPTADRTITLPNATGTVSLVTATETLTNKTLTSPTFNGFTVASSQTVAFGSNRVTNVADPVGNQDAATKAYVDANAGSEGGASGFTNSTFTTAPGSDGDFDLSFNVDQDTQETPFEAGGTDAFGVALGEVYDQMEPVGSTSVVDLGAFT